MIIAGIAVFEDRIVGSSGGRCDGFEYASTVGVMAGISALLGGVFCVLELVGCSI